MRYRAYPMKEGSLQTELMPEHMDAWGRDGFLTVDQVVSSKDLEVLRASASRFVEISKKLDGNTDRFKLTTFSMNHREGAKSQMLQQVAEPHELAPEWMHLARDPNILDVVQSVLGPNIMLYYSMMIMKPPRQGTEFSWHQDLAFFPHNKANIVACQVYLDDSTEENGCVRVVPGSHRQGLFNHYNEEGIFTGVVNSDTSSFDERSVPVTVRAGGMAMWHGLTLHTSGPNLSESPRRAVVLQFKNPEATLLSGAFNRRLEVSTVGLMVRGADPSGDLLSAP